jgi:hypothetical protein
VFAAPAARHAHGRAAHADEFRDALSRRPDFVARDERDRRADGALRRTAAAGAAAN